MQAMIDKKVQALFTLIVSYKRHENIESGSSLVFAMSGNGMEDDEYCKMFWDLENLKNSINDPAWEHFRELVWKEAETNGEMSTFCDDWLKIESENVVDDDTEMEANQGVEEMPVQVPVEPQECIYCNNIHKVENSNTVPVDDAIWREIEAELGLIHGEYGHGFVVDNADTQQSLQKRFSELDIPAGCTNKNNCSVEYGETGNCCCSCLYAILSFTPTCWTRYESVLDMLEQYQILNKLQ